MKKFLLVLSYLICITQVVFAQSILNPSFENVNSPPCAYNLSNSAFNAVVLNVTAFGVYENCDIMNGTCGFGSAHQGDWFIGLSVPPAANVGDAIALELSSPLIAGQTYRLEFYQKRDIGYQSNYIAAGYSQNDTSQGIVFANFIPVAPTTWQLYSTIFTPSTNAQYLTLSATPSIYGWNHIDDLSLTNITGIENPLPGNDEGFVVFPNPFSDEYSVIRYQFETGDVLSIIDLLGKIIFIKKILSPTSDLRLPTSGFSPGIYFVNVTTDKGNVVKKVVRQ